MIFTLLVPNNHLHATTSHELVPVKVQLKMNTNMPKLPIG